MAQQFMGADEMSVHSEVVTKQLSSEELAELDRKYGKPTQPLGKNKPANYLLPDIKPVQKKLCKEPGCDEKARSKGYCDKHYQKNIYSKRRKQK